MKIFNSKCYLETLGIFDKMLPKFSLKKQNRNFEIDKHLHAFNNYDAG